MSTSSSIAQFMAILSGGTNPSLLRQTQPATTGEKPAVDFEGLLNQNPELKNVITLNTASTNDNLTTLGDETTIWQFIQQQANIDSGNQLVLNLSEKGIPDSVIQELKSVFGENDLITIVRDPKLNTQFDNALNAISQNTDLKTDSLITVVQGILQQNKGDLDNTITFSVSQETTTDEIIETLVNNERPQSTTIRQVDNDHTIEAADNFSIQLVASQTPTPVSINPFAIKAEAGQAPKALEKILENVTAYGSGQASKSLQANINAHVNATSSVTNYNGTNPNIDFSEFMMSAEGEILNIDGDYAAPFEAALKTASQATNPLLSQPQATQSNPATSMVAISLTKMVQKSIDGEQSQRYRLQLDPPEMGRIDIEMDIIENTNKMKVVITAEKPESLGLLQRDMHTLLKAMQDAGFDNISNSDIAFNLSQHGEDMAGGRGNNNHGHPSSQNGHDGRVDGDMDTIESEMSLIIDPVTGQQSVNMLV